VRSVEQGRLLVQSVGLVDDVMGVVNQLYVLGKTRAPVPNGGHDEKKNTDLPIRQ